eukprot:COSAG01_NODE_1359_length_10584_cov_133.767668_6_plen_57_part_00
MLGGFTRSLSALVHFTLHTGAGVDSVVYIRVKQCRYTPIVFSIYSAFPLILRRSLS